MVSDHDEIKVITPRETTECTWSQTTQSQVMMDPWGNGKGNKNIPGFKWKWSYKFAKT